MSDIKIIITGDDSGLEKATKRAQTELVNVAKAAQKTDSSLQTLSRSGGQSMFNLTEKIKALQSALFTEKDRGKIALYNAEIRTAEVELKKLETAGVASSSGLATGFNQAFSSVRKLAYIIPGVGIAGIIGFATEPIIKFISSIFEATEAEKKLIATQKEFNEDVSKGYGKEAADLITLRAAIESETLSRDKRLQAIKNLKKEFPGLFDGLSTEQLLTGKVGDAYDKATAAILRKARATAATTQIEKIETDRIAILLDYEKKLADINDKIAKAKDVRTVKRGLSDDAGTIQTTTAEEIKAGLAFQRAGLNALTHNLLNELDKQEKLYLKFVIDGADRTIEIEKKKQEKITKIQKEAIINRASDADKLYFGEPATRTTGSTLTPTITVSPHIEFKIDPVQAKKVTDGIQALINGEEISKIIQSTLESAVTSAAEGVAGVLTGQKNAFSSLFDGIAYTLAAGVKSIGQYLVKTYGLIAVIEKIKFSNPAVGVAVGFALQVLGALIQSNIGKTKAFATGVRDFQGGGIVTVGERGPERIFLPTHSTVQPNNEMNAYGGGNQVFIPAVTIQGPDIVIAFNRALQQMGRNN